MWIIITLMSYKKEHRNSTNKIFIIYKLYYKTILSIVEIKTIIILKR